jgi:hypothetical protein
MDAWRARHCHAARSLGATVRIFRRYFWWGALALALLAGLLLSRPSGQRPAAIVTCPDIVKGCALPHVRLQVRFDRQPHPMQAFRVEVALPDVREVHARFSMRGMEMGLNRYRLLSDGPGRWHAEVMLPACIQGRNDWSLLLEANGSSYEVPFSSG